MSCCKYLATVDDHGERWAKLLHSYVLIFSPLVGEHIVTNKTTLSGPRFELEVLMQIAP